MIFKAEPEMIAALELAGIDVVSTANNHARDQGSHGVEFTLDWLDRHQIAAVGTGKSAEAAHAGVVIERNGLRFGFLAYTYDQSNGNHADVDDRVAVMDTARMREDVARLSSSVAARADVIIVSMHAGDGVLAQIQCAAGVVRSGRDRCGRARGGGPSSARHPTVGALRAMA